MEDMRFDTMLKSGTLVGEGLRQLIEDITGLSFDCRPVVRKRGVDAGFGGEPLVVAGDLPRREDEVADPDSARLTCGKQESIPCTKGSLPRAESARYC
jgi:hypothetical protein